MQHPPPAAAADGRPRAATAPIPVPTAPAATAHAPAAAAGGAPPPAASDSAAITSGLLGGASGSSSSPHAMLAAATGSRQRLGQQQQQQQQQQQPQLARGASPSSCCASLASTSISLMLAGEEEEEEGVGVGGDDADYGGRRYVRHVVVGVDNSANSQAALRFAVQHIYRAGDAFHLVHIIPEPPTLHPLWPGAFVPPDDALEREEFREAAAMVRSAFAPLLLLRGQQGGGAAPRPPSHQQQHQGGGSGQQQQQQQQLPPPRRAHHAAAGRHGCSVPAVAHLIVAPDDPGSIAASLADKAAALGAALVVVAPHGRSGLAEWWLGSVTRALLQGGRLPVAVVPPPLAEGGRGQ